jgi:dienelactone hydrolase/uncharacterized damage-inducible protein DinB
MTKIVLFHHAQGLTPGVVAFADELRRAGHTVHTPDLFEGRTFATVEEGVAHAGEIGFDEVSERGVRAVEELPDELVYAGFSLGVMPAQRLAQTRPGARGALLFHSCLPTSEFSPSWPVGVPVQIHGMDADPFFAGEGDLDAARALVAAATDAELFLYPGDQHLFADSSLPSYDADAFGQLTGRVLGFLDDVRERDEHGRPEPPIAAGETATLLGFLDYQRATFAWKCAGLDAKGLSATVGASTLTLGGMLKHLAYVEDYWFSQRLHGRDWRPPLDSGDWPANPDWDWHFTSAAEDSPERLRAIWESAVAQSRTRVAEALADGDLAGLARRPWPNGESPSLRWILVHMIEEYARHNGHADLIREAFDGGQIGE